MPAYFKKFACNYTFIESTNQFFSMFCNNQAITSLKSHLLKTVFSISKSSIYSSIERVRSNKSVIKIFLNAIEIVRCTQLELFTTNAMP